MKRPTITERMKVDCLLWLADSEAEVRCPECGMMILPGQRIEWDHRHCLALDGPHVYENLRPVHYDPCHKQKSARDVKALAKVRRLANPRPSKRPMKSSGKSLASRPFQKQVSRWKSKHAQRAAIPPPLSKRGNG